MLREEWINLPESLKRAIQTKFKLKSWRDIENIKRIDWARCAVDLPYVKSIEFYE